MSVQVEKLEKNMAKLTVEVPAEEVEKALQAAYMKEKNKISIPGFRKGKVPRAMIEKMYGAAVFYEEAANILIQDNYAAAMEESKEDIVSRHCSDRIRKTFHLHSRSGCKTGSNTWKIQRCSGN